MCHVFVSIPASGDTMVAMKWINVANEYTAASHEMEFTQVLIAAAQDGKSLSRSQPNGKSSRCQSVLEERAHKCFHPSSVSTRLDVQPRRRRRPLYIASPLVIYNLLARSALSVSLFFSLSSFLFSDEVNFWNFADVSVLLGAICIYGPALTMDHFIPSLLHCRCALR